MGGLERVHVAAHHGPHRRTIAGMEPVAPARRLRLLVAVVAASLAGLVTAHPAGAASTPTTGRASAPPQGIGGGNVEALSLVDAHGRYVLFSGQVAYEAADTNGDTDVYLRDRLTSTTTRVSLTDGDAQITGKSHLCGASPNVRFVAFWSNGTNLPGGGTGQVHLRDRTQGTTTIVSVASGGAASAAVSGSGIFSGQRCDVSEDGRYVAFHSEGTNLVPSDTNGESDVFRRDRTTASTIRVSVMNAGGQVAGGSYTPQMSDDGQAIVFSSTAAFTGGDSDADIDIFRRDLSTSSTSVVSLRSGGGYANASSYQPSISGDGSIVAFGSAATDLLPAGQTDTNGKIDVFVRKIGGEKELVSVTSTEVQGLGASLESALSHDGRYVAFTSAAPNLHLFDGNGVSDVFVRDRQLGLTVLASQRATAPLAGNASSGYGGPSLSANGRVTAFSSQASLLARGDFDGQNDIYVRDVGVDHTPFASFDALVAQQLLDFEGRAPTAAEKAEWTARLVYDELSPDALIDAMAHGPTWAGRRAPVARLYWAFFLRAPDTAGLAHWVGQLAAGKSLHWIAGRFALSQEFKDTYGSLSNSAFVTLVYQNVFDRDPDAAGLAFWTGKLDSGATTRGSVLVGFSESTEGKRLLAPPVDIVLASLGMVGSVPSKSLLAYYLGLGVPVEEIISIIRHDPAYAAQL